MTRKCKFCEKEFKTNREWQKFCCKNCHDDYWAGVHSDKRYLVRRLEALEKKLKKED